MRMRMRMRIEVDRVRITGDDAMVKREPKRVEAGWRRRRSEAIGDG